MSLHSEDPNKKSTIAVDFDGVIHSYTKGWQDGTCYDVPIEGSLETLAQLMTKYNVFILSTRDPNAIYDWFKVWGGHFFPIDKIEVVADDNGPFWDKPGILGITNKKLAAISYIDDRAIRFTNWRDMKNYYL